MSATVTLDQFKRFAVDIAPAARAVLMARVFADMERQRVDTYIRPIFDAYGFTYGVKWGDARAGQPLTTPEHLYLVEDDVQVAAYFDECDAAHRAHGFTGPKGHCPALRAANLVIAAERELLKLGSDLFGVRFEDTYGERRAKAIDLLIGAALKSAEAVQS